MKKLIKNLIILLALTSLVPASLAKFREVGSEAYENDIPILSTETMEQNISLPTFETVNAIKDNNEKLYGVVGKSQVLNFDKDIERVSITNDEVADIVVLSQKQILINGKKAGTTSIIFWSKDGSKPIFYNLLIQQNTDSFLQAIEHIAPNENISILFNELISFLSMIISPFVKEIIPNIVFNNVLFPLPFTPTILINFPL